jgi:hypothetical protein
MPYPAGRPSLLPPAHPLPTLQGLSTPHIGPHQQKPREISLLWRVNIKGLPTSSPPLEGLYLHSPLRTAHPGIAVILLHVVAEALEPELGVSPEIAAGTSSDVWLASTEAPSGPSQGG